ncbi:hypothetical protein HUB98_05920 [Paenibacillus barcinonensis]|uniref:Uncharacterized protein n=1 Tax=Paenibacillus barcinonensis TaxID=198119 RepID=A0A2V4VD87_PAEBA|nr:hypothetical protein [Paenibacillus barcinonensis]PYE51542.1 hypothetical protein DFQ00_102336 [Paenibacillus barcinonensis]QKS55918.1 hypothetical protein HUB98_05920 [Paenibacillus barcinonensis]
MNQETKKRTETQRDKIIAALKRAGDSGVTNVELNKIALRYNARIQELYVRGYKIHSEELDGGITKYILVSEPTEPFKKPDKAVDILIDDIESKYNGNISARELNEYLETRGFTVRRKIGSYC